MHETRECSSIGGADSANQEPEMKSNAFGQFDSNVQMTNVQTSGAWIRAAQIGQASFGVARVSLFLR
jgi:hypothetical protein